MTVPILTIGHGNAHNRPTVVDFIRDANADSFGGDELQRILPEVNAIRETRLIGDEEGWDEPRNRANSTAIITANRNPRIGSLSRQVSERIPGKVEKFAPDRVLRGSFFEHPVAKAVGREGVAHWELHPDATVMKHKPDHPIVREYREALESTRGWMRQASRDGLVNVLTADIQTHARFRAPYGPRELLAEPLGLRCRWVRIDCIMVDPLLRFAGPLKTRKLYDHTGFVARLRAA